MLVLLLPCAPTLMLLWLLMLLVRGTVYIRRERSSGGDCSRRSQRDIGGRVEQIVLVFGLRVHVERLVLEPHVVLLLLLLLLVDTFARQGRLGSGRVARVASASAVI